MTDILPHPRLQFAAPRFQAALPEAHYDRWVTAGSQDAAYFYRTHQGFLVRFPGVVDFQISADGSQALALPVPSAPHEAVVDLFHNAIIPLTDNHRGALSLHGSAALYKGAALGFIGQSRSGKTTLAGAFAMEGHPFITEDIIRLARISERYEVAPTRPVLRLFNDSAAHLSAKSKEEVAAGKARFSASEVLPFAPSRAPLRTLFLLERAGVSQIEVERIGAVQALTSLLQQAFILDVEDNDRLSDHFARIGLLAESMPCFRLDYPRRFDILPEVIRAIIKHAGETH